MRGLKAIAPPTLEPIEVPKRNGAHCERRSLFVPLIDVTYRGCSSAVNSAVTDVCGVATATVP